jgi:hypothetical protein
MILHEGGSDGRAATTIRCQNRTPAADLACAKLLDWHGLANEVWTLGDNAFCEKFGAGQINSEYGTGMAIGSQHLD